MTPALVDGEISVAGDAGQGAFHFRIGVRADLSHCAELLPQGQGLSPPVRQRLVEAWERVLDSGLAIFAVVEDLERPYPGNIEGFGLSVFVTQPFFEELAQRPQPHVSRRFYERILRGDKVMLTPDEAARANVAGGGLNALALHSALRHDDFSNPRTASALIAFSAAFFFFHGGFRLNAMFGEVFGPQAALYMEASGFRRTPYAAAETPANPAEANPAEQPHMFMLRREWITAGAVSPLNHLFGSQAPRILFSPAEQRLLERAMLNEADASIAAAMGVSANAIKRTWRSIFERVSRRAPFILPETPEDQWTSNSRGPEKRGRLLEYLRTHLEELRPAKAA